MSKKYLIPAGLIVLVIILWFAFGSEEGESVELYATPQTGPFKVTITTTGELRAKNSTEIRGPRGMREFRVYQVKIQKLVPEGTRVEKGDFVAELDRSEIADKLKDAKLDLKDQQTKMENAKLDSSLSLSQERNNIIDLKYKLTEAKIAVKQSKYESPAKQRQVKINLDQAQRALEQAKKKYKMQKKKSEVQIQQIENRLREARRKVSRIEQTMKEFTIRAPEKGMVIYRRQRDGSKITEGSQIQVWDPIVAKLPDFSVMNSITYVNEVDIQKVHEGQPVDIGLDAMPEKELTGKVTDVANIGEQRPNSNSKVFQVVVRVSKSDSTLRPAMTTSNEILVESVDSALYVPLETVHTKGSMNVVFKRNGRMPVMQQVVLGLMNNNDVIIKEGVQMDDELYLSIPADTSDIEVNKLPPEVLKKYHQQEEIKKQQVDPEDESRPRKIPPNDRRDEATLQRGNNQ